MNGAPPTKHEKLDQIDVVVRCVDQRGRQMDEKWGFGRLVSLVPIEWAERFRAQRRKFSGAVWEYDVDAVTRHGNAMLRAYDKLDEMAAAAGAEAIAPEQWEVDGPDGLIVLVRDLRDVSRAQLYGRQAQVWSLDEIASVIRAHPMLVAAKHSFPGATVEAIRPDENLKQGIVEELNDAPY